MLTSPCLPASWVWTCVCVPAYRPQIRNKLNQEQNGKLKQQKDLLNKRNMEVTLMDKRISELRERLFKKKAEARQKENLPVRLRALNTLFSFRLFLWKCFWQKSLVPVRTQSRQCRSSIYQRNTKLWLFYYSLCGNLLMSLLELFKPSAIRTF